MCDKERKRPLSDLVAKRVLERTHKAQFDKTFPLVVRKRPENLRRIVKMPLVKDLLHVVTQQRQVEQECEPTPRKQEQNGKERMCSHLRHDKLGVQSFHYGRNFTSDNSGPRGIARRGLTPLSLLHRSIGLI